MKKALRQEVLDARFALTHEERRAKSRQIEKRLFALPDFLAAIVLFYASFRSEVETHEMVRRALAAGKRIVLPKVAGKELDLFEIRDFDRDVKPGRWDIPEPAAGTRISPDQIDLVIVPGAAFDAAGNRLGYGGGFYDRLLKEFRGRTVALAFELQMLPKVPADPHDVPVQTIVTETRVIEVKS